MNSILQTCTPRLDIISGMFNPEIYTASLRVLLKRNPAKANDLKFQSTVGRPAGRPYKGFSGWVFPFGSTFLIYG